MWTWVQVPKMGIKQRQPVQQGDTMAKINNFNAIRPALVAAHNQDNKRPINKEKCEDLNIDLRYLTMWISDVNKLQKTVEAYVDKAWNAKFDSTISEGDIYAARERIYPKWKELLCCAESEKNQKQLHVSEFDIEALIKFAWTFMGSGVGTCVCHMNDNKFRQKVESLIGCLIAGNAILTDHERDILDTFNSAQKSIDRCNDKTAELEEKKKSWELHKKGLTEAEKGFAAFIDNQIRQINEELKTVKENLVKAEALLHEVSTEAKSIQLKVKYSGK